MLSHIPVLLKESIAGLNLKKNSSVIDATADGGGHAAEILKKLGKRGKLVALDLDPEMAERLKDKFRKEKRVKVFHLNFRDIGKLAKSLSAGGRRPDAIFFDLGLSSLQLSASGRGFSFQKNEPLDMRFNPEKGQSTKELLKKISLPKLEDIIRTYGEESWAKKIAQAIGEVLLKRKIETSAELANIIKGAVRRRGKMHPATKTFQALRIYLNEELENLEMGLKAAFEILAPKGRVAIISFHSMEDRIVKNFFRDKARGQEGRLIIKKVLRPGREEILLNPRARSAKLRIIEKIK
ncbi:MAG: 16S rRNA (cytosine(1402)-N(4))-methyltransferase RsmH [bacterium]|nr:16S rRNA (cytosine(1402)-N(4))-methyltransferase RsmH [bacterium]